ncbi:NAD(P)H-hydrate dehydratase [Sphingoaurantiacus capsulatus]|uniref:ADP-dependent (S)-NAD(P)H-hydrate dehydratase n=1 Tax=Sphingoaurantiacus capsulatus TaxID=1771310 RepID=A0ABV7X6T1_9SPHN
MSEPIPVDAELLRSMPLPFHGDDADKDERGRILVIGGSRAVPGALLLAGVAALRAGAGKLQLATVGSIAPHIGVAVPEALVMSLPESDEGEIAPDAAAEIAHRLGRCDAVLIGPGMLDEEAATAITVEAMGVDGPSFVIDAGALCNLRAEAKAMARHDGRIVLTPHAGEMAKLMGVTVKEIAADPAAAATRAAAELGAVVALKGGRTVIAVPDGRTWEYSQGQVGLATSGSGDTLAGVVAGLLARGAEPHEAAIWGVYLHGEAGNRLSQTRGPVGFLARELLAEIPAIMAGLAS